MSETYQKKEVAAHYDASRAMPDETLALWACKLKEMAPAQHVRRVLDLGGGTGRFAGMLQKAYSCPVIVLDPSEEMLKQGRARGLKKVAWLRGTAEEMPFAAGYFDLIWMCQVFHHLENKQKAFKEVFRVLSPDGCLVIRNGTLENDAEIKWMDLVPEARRIEKETIPFRDEIIKTVSPPGFDLIKADTVYQKFASSYTEYYEKISQRGLSLLISISDEAFNRGMKKVKEWAVAQPENCPVYEPVDIFVFRKRNG